MEFCCRAGGDAAAESGMGRKGEREKVVLATAECSPATHILQVTFTHKVQIATELPRNKLWGELSPVT